MANFRNTEPLQNLFVAEGVFNIDVKYMGGFCMIVTFSTMEEMEDWVMGHKDWFLKWFVFEEPWFKKNIAKCRFVWLSSIGVPLHVWNTDTFSNIGHLCGENMTLDEYKSKDLSFDSKVLVLTKSI